MGEIADMMMDGTLCASCGSLIEDLIPDEGKELLESPGYPRNCGDCESDVDEENIEEDVAKGIVCKKCHEFMDDLLTIGEDYVIIKDPPGKPRICGECK